MSEARIDFETRSDVDLRTCGSGPYFASPRFMALLAAYSIDDGPIGEWRYTEPCPDDLRAHIEAGGFIRAFNASFERQCFDELAKRNGWPRPAIDRYRCTAAEAAAMGLPRSLDMVGEALGLSVLKDKRGSALIRLFSIPKPDGTFNDPAAMPKEFDEFMEYCRRDIETEAAAAKRIVPLSTEEQALYTLDQIVNARGVRIDRASAMAATNLASKAKFALDQEMRAVTGGAVNKCSEVAKLTAWVEAQGVEMKSAAKADLEELLTYEDIPANVRKAIELRQEAAKTSVAKLTAMLNRAEADDRVRNSFLFCAASTGRWSSVGIQLQNLSRPRRIFDEAKLNKETLFQVLKSESPEWLKFMYGDELGRPLNLISDAMRSFIWAAPGHDFIQADYSGIEGAVAAWLAGEQWKLDTLFEIMADPSKPDMYRRTAAGIMNTTTDVIDKKHPLRQSVGKTSELALGFQGGVSAFHSMARNYGVQLDPLFAPVWEAADDERRAKAVKRYERCLKRGDSKTDLLSREAWIACEIIKVGWRATNPAIAQAWHLFEAGIRAAIETPGQKVDVLKCSYIVTHGYLWCRLPSGRCLAYASPKLKDQVWAKVIVDGELLDAEVMERELAERLQLAGKAEIQGDTSPKATVLGVDSATRRFTRYPLFGGLGFQNCVQAIARDVLANGMRKAEAAGYPIVATIHDELLAEVKLGTGDLKAFEKLICELPAWAAGLPLTAGGWRGKRYRKD